MKERYRQFGTKESYLKIFKWNSLWKLAIIKIQKARQMIDSIINTQYCKINAFMKTKPDGASFFTDI